MQMPDSYGKVKYAQVKAALDQIAEHYQDTPERLNDVDISFEYNSLNPSTPPFINLPLSVAALTLQNIVSASSIILGSIDNIIQSLNNLQLSFTRSR